MRKGHKIVTSALARDLTYRPNGRPVSGAAARHRELPLLDAAGRQDGPAGAQRTLVLIPEAESVKAARDFTASTLRGWKADSLIEEAVIVASELVTNAIRHGTPRSAASGGEDPALAWQRHTSRVVCVVTDSSCDLPVLEEAHQDCESGRGLQVVHALAAAWGCVMLGAHGKAVWAALLLP